MQKGNFIMTKTLIIESGQKPTEEELREVEEAKNPHDCKFYCFFHTQ